MSFNTPISPVHVNQSGDHTDEDKTEPFVNLNDSMASNSSSSSAGDESPQPSSSAAGLRDEHLLRDNPIDRVNMTTDDGKPITLSDLDRRFRAQHYYNNPADEHTFLTENFIPFMGMVIVSNLLYWLHQVGEGFETTRWFALWGWQRVFLEALQQTLCRLPYPRIYNCSNLHDWIRDLHDQSSNIALVPYPWAERPSPSPFSATTYKPITEHYCFNHRHKSLQGFVIGAQDGTDGVAPGCWMWKYRFFAELPDRMLAYVQTRLPHFDFGGSSIMVQGVYMTITVLLGIVATVASGLLAMTSFTSFMPIIHIILSLTKYLHPEFFLAVLALAPWTKQCCFHLTSAQNNLLSPLNIYNLECFPLSLPFTSIPVTIFLALPLTLLTL